MAIVVEDGSGKADANSFVTVDEADDFWSLRSDPDWAGAEVPEKEAALVNAADYLGFAYTWRGQPRLTTQALCWPRSGATYANGEVVDPTTVPVAVQRAAILLAREALSTDLLRQTSDNETLTKESVQVGNISQSREFDRGTSGPNLKTFLPIDAVLADLLSSRRGRSRMRSVPLVRR